MPQFDGGVCEFLMEDAFESRFIRLRFFEILREEAVNFKEPLCEWSISKHEAVGIEVPLVYAIQLNEPVAHVSGARIDAENSNCHEALRGTGKKKDARRRPAFKARRGN